MRVVLIIIDGLGDEAHPEIGMTPLELASTKSKTLNYLAKNGICGLLYPIAPGIPPASDTGHLAIFGYDSNKEYPGRGFFEAMGAGIRPSGEEIAFRVNLATVKREKNYFVVLDRRAGRISGSDAKGLYQALNEAIQDAGLPANILHTFEHRGVLIIRGEDFLGAVTDTDPHEINKPLLASTPIDSLSEDDKKRAEKTAEIINKISRLAFDVLDKHEINAERKKKGLLPANMILVRGGGIAKRITPFEEKWGYKAAFVAGGNLYKGLARALGMTEIHVEGATGNPKTNLPGKVDGVIRALNKGFDFVYLHIKGTDTLSHDKKPKEKADFILKIDKALEPLLELDDVLIVVTGDHSTSSVRGRHIGLPVPIVFWSEQIRKDQVNVFNESTCARGGFGIIKGLDVMNLINDLVDRSVEHGTIPSKKILYL